MKYFKDIWNWLDIVIISISLVCVSFNGYRTWEVNPIQPALCNSDMYSAYNHVCTDS